ncbi:MAG TPA: TonB-dependent receptor, partial [Caulobacterales bacterium]|nr:TonB-dependent receptor [Caulobacterales bacterium]
VSGNRTTRTPEWTANLSGIYTHHTDNGTFGATASIAYNSGYYVAPDNRLATPAYTILNGELSWTTPDDRYKFALWGRNLTDETKLLYLTAAQFDLAIYDEPRTWGVSVTANFN